MHDRMVGEDAEIRLGYDPKFHPRHFAEHDRKILVELLDDDKDAICIAQSQSKIEASDAIMFPLVKLAIVTMFNLVRVVLNNQKEAIKSMLEAVLVEPR